MLRSMKFYWYCYIITSFVVSFAPMVTSIQLLAQRRSISFERLTWIGDFLQGSLKIACGLSVFNGRFSNWARYALYEVHIMTHYLLHYCVLLDSILSLPYHLAITGRYLVEEYFAISLLSDCTLGTIYLLAPYRRHWRRFTCTESPHQPYVDYIQSSLASLQNSDTRMRAEIGAHMETFTHLHPRFLLHHLQFFSIIISFSYNDSLTRDMTLYMYLVPGDIIVFGNEYLSFMIMLNFWFNGFN